MSAACPVAQGVGTMRALVVFESAFGNTEQVARAVFQGMFRRLQDVALLDVASAPPRLPPELEMLVVGGPMQALGISRPTTHPDAYRQGMVERPTRPGLAQWLGSLEPPERPVHAAAFDTRIHTPPSPGFPAVAAWRTLRRDGYQLAGDAESFCVMGIRGPLCDGEVERARTWGVRLIDLVVGPRPTGPGPLEEPAR